MKSEARARPGVRFSRPAPHAATRATLGTHGAATLAPLSSLLPSSRQQSHTLDIEGGVPSWMAAMQRS